MGRPRVNCLRHWSAFIRERDGHRCVDCHATERLSAHHICRKSLFGFAQFDTGNGITLCHRCHREVHLGFNGHPSLLEPVDSQGGEKLNSMERLYSILLDDAVDRGLMREDFYYLSDRTLRTLKKMQSYDEDTFFPGSRLEQAYLILAETERSFRHAIAEANGFPILNEPMLPGALTIFFDNVDPPNQKPLILHRYSPRSPADE